MLAELIHLNTHYSRSIHLERDAHSSEVLQAYIPTNRALQVLAKITATLTEAEMPRAWSLIGPYGSGKSSFAVFLNHLLDDAGSNTVKIAFKALEQANLKLANQFVLQKTTKRYAKILVTGSPASLAQHFVQAMLDSASEFWATQNNKPPIIEALRQASQQPQTVKQIIALLSQLQNAIAAVGGAGLLIAIDELGKFLEYEARHQGANDIFLLQELAELAKQKHPVKILLLVLMHQAFDQYAKGLTEQTKNEWLKVQGRFETLPFLESSEQTLRLLAQAFSHSFTPTEEALIKEKTAYISQILAANHALPSALDASSATDLFSRCYPLHPLSLLILPLLCQKVAQNERTLFSYLSSNEIYAFKHSLAQLQYVGDWILPHHLFDYFLHNSPSLNSDHLTYRRWLEVISALERLGDAPLVEQQLLKTIGLFNIINSQGGLKASPTLIELCLLRSQDKASLESLINKAVLQYRKFADEYRVWQGSDFDLESVVLETRQQAQLVSIAQLLNQRQTLPPLVARKYSIQYACLRYFQVLFTDGIELKKLKPVPDTAQIIFYLAETDDDIVQFHAFITQPKQPVLTIYVLHRQTVQLKTVLAETVALERIQHENQLLHGDPVAQRELKDWLHKNQQQEQSLVSSFLEQPEQNDWYQQVQKLDLNHRRGLQRLLSTILEKVYKQSPIIKNELINRDKPSAQANGAIKKLVSLMLNQAEQAELGLAADRFPPEKSIYRAVLKETGIHRQQHGEWGFYPPLANSYQLDRVWLGIENFITAQIQQSKTVSLSYLYSYLQKPPFGIKAGVLPLLFIAYYLTNQRRLALYEDGVFCPQLDETQAEILLKRPELFSFESFATTGIQADLFNQYLEKLVGKIPSDDNSLMDIIKPLYKFIKGLPDYTLQTKNLPKQTLAVRDAFNQTQSPIQLLFEYLPQACGFPPFTQQHLSQGQSSEAFLNVLATELKQLAQAYPQLLSQFQQQLAQILDFAPASTLPDLRQQIQQRYQGLEKYSLDTQGLQAFIRRLQADKDNDSACNDSAWLESIAALLAKVPPQKWRLEQQTQAEYQLKLLAERLKELEKVHLEQQKIDSKSPAKAMLLRLISGESEQQAIVYDDPELNTQAEQIIAAINPYLAKADKKLRLAIAAQILLQTKA